MAYSIANALCRNCNNAIEALDLLDKLVSRNSDFERMTEFRCIKDALQEILLDSGVLKESIGYRVDEWYLDYLRK